MKVTQKDVLDTANLLFVDVSESEIESLTKSFAALIDYFAVLDTALDAIAKDESKKTTGEGVGAQSADDICRFRNARAVEREGTEALIAKSEEYEDNYVLMPNVL